MGDECAAEQMHPDIDGNQSSICVEQVDAIHTCQSAAGYQTDEQLHLKQRQYSVTTNSTATTTTATTATTTTATTTTTTTAASDNVTTATTVTTATSATTTAAISVTTTIPTPTITTPTRNNNNNNKLYFPRRLSRHSRTPYRGL